MIPTTVPASPFEHAAGRLDAAYVADLLTRDGVTGLGRGDGLHGADLGRGLRPPFRPVRAPGGRRPRSGRHRQSSWPPIWSRGPSPTTRPPTRSCSSSAGGSACGRSSARAPPPAIWPEPCPSLSSTAPNERPCAPTTATRRRSPSTTISMESSRLSAVPACRSRTLFAPPRSTRPPFTACTTAAASTPGYRADLLVVEDPAFPHPRDVIHAGTVVAQTGKVVVPLPPTPPLASPQFRLELSDAREPRPGRLDGVHRARAIHLTPRAIVSDERLVEVHGCRRPPAGRTPSRDICLAALIERRPGPDGLPCRPQPGRRAGW